MINWIKNIFRKREYYPKQRGLFDFFMIYTDADHEIRSMHQFIREQNRFTDYGSCDLFRLGASKQVRFRYGLNQFHVGMAWYLLEQYFKGNITIKDDALPKP